MAKDREKRKYCTFKTFKSSPLAKTFTNILKCNFYESCKNIVTFECPKITASTGRGYLGHTIQSSLDLLA